MEAEKRFGEFLSSFFKRAVERELNLELKFDDQSFDVDGKKMVLNGKTVLSTSDGNDEG